MSWLVYVAINVLADSSRIYTDNYISDTYFKGRGAIAQKYFLGFFTLFAGLVIAAFVGLDFSAVSWEVVAWLFFSGVLSSLAGIFYYKALEIEDSTNLGIFIQLSPILYLILGFFFLGDTITPLQLLAFAIILVAPFLIIFSSRKRSRHIKFRAFLFAFCYVCVDVVGNLIFAKTSTPEVNFFSEMALVYFGIGITHLLTMLVLPKSRARFHRVMLESRHKVVRPLLFSGTFGVLKTLAYRLALTSAPAVALASVAADATEPIVIFFMGLVLTLIWPTFGREKLDARTIVVHLIATVLIVIGIILMQL